MMLTLHTLDHAMNYPAFTHPAFTRHLASLLVILKHPVEWILGIKICQVNAG